MYVDVPAFLSQIVVLWLCFLLLPFSQPKGKPKFRYTDHFKDEVNDKKKFCCCEISTKRYKNFMGCLYLLEEEG